MSITLSGSRTFNLGRINGANAGYYNSTTDPSDPLDIFVLTSNGVPAANGSRSIKVVRTVGELVTIDGVERTQNGRVTCTISLPQGFALGTIDTMISDISEIISTSTLSALVRGSTQF